MQRLSALFFGFLFAFALAAALVSTVHAQTAPAVPGMQEVLVENRWAKVTRADYETELLRVPPELRGGFATSSKRVIDLLVRLLVTKSLAAQARAGELYKDAELQRRRALEIDRVDAGVLVAATEENAGRSFDARMPQFEARARELYLVDTDKYRIPEQVDASHILIDTRTRDREAALKIAQGVRAKLAAGADFSELAKEVSDDPSAKQNGGHLNWFDRKTMDPAFTEVAFSLKNVGELSQPVLSSFGYHVIRLDGHRAAHARTFEEVLPELIAEERRKYIATQRDDLISKVRDDPMSKMNQPAVDALMIKIDPETIKKAMEAAQPK
jgi:peptidyl-prolyl cis-trans isomerase C